MEKKASWNKPVCMTVAQEELNAKVMVASCSAWFACPLHYYSFPTESPVNK
ncbi:MAG: hypothetical protein IKU11_05785 [Clostridia bacterium]|nr:hypothetical protein [Clostridia bacterium]